MLNFDSLMLRPFQPGDQEACKALVLSGLVDHWGFLDPSLNPDLNDIAASYAEGLFLTAWLEGDLVGTGALRPAGEGTYELVRMSVARRLRGQGLGRRILKHIESYAQEMRAARIVLETTETWEEVVRFYLQAGYAVTHRKDGDVYFAKTLGRLDRSRDVLEFANKEHIEFAQLTEPTPEIALSFSRWENNPVLIPLARPNKNQEDLEKREPVTVEDLAQRLKHHQIILIYLDGQLIGEMDYQVDPRHLFNKVAGTAWISILIGEEIGRGKGIGRQAMQYLEEQIKSQGLKRIELGVFEFNIPAIQLYHKAGFIEIGRVNDFTYWQGRLWQDIRMEKYLR